MKALVGAFNQEKALLGAYSVITNLRMDLLKLYFQENTHNNPRAEQEYAKLSCPEAANLSKYFSFDMEAGDGLVWFGDTVHFAYGGDRRVVSMSLIEGTSSVFQEDKKPHLSWDWYNHGVEDGGLIQGPYFPQIYPTLLQDESDARERRQIGYFTGKWSKMFKFMKGVFQSFGGSKKTRCQFSELDNVG